MIEVRTNAATVLRRFIETISTFQAADVVPMLGPDASLEFPFAGKGFPDSVRGETEIRQFLSWAEGTFGRLELHGLQVYEAVDPGLAFAEFRSTGRFLATGKDYANRYCVVAAVRDGLVVRYREYFNPLGESAERAGRAAE